MQSLLLGLGDIIADAFGWVIQTLVSPIIEIAFKFILAPIIKLTIELTMAVVGAYLYMFGCFLLQLIDFVEVTFRALAGMESISASGMSMELSLDGGSGDILIQLIRHPDIQSAFVSMCVVGLFLLVVTTVFQIIKVEYTTEGAKNAKGPIFQKAFKGLANLMLLPMLVIFGIVFANQLLGLLDTATKGSGENPTISGLIFVSSAHEAHYLEKELHWEVVPTGSPDIMAIQGTIQVITNFLANIGGYVTGSYAEGDFANKSSIDAIESGFISQTDGHKYYRISDVSDFYNYVHINYLLMFFGGVFALKTLYYACFGMIIRLYKCAVLFIISPAIIGMTPVNEGGLGKWRTAFIGQVLSAYGTVLSLNMFFIVVRVLLSIDVKFSAGGSYIGGAGGAGFIGSGLMTLLLKCLFVLAGCLLIEKFAKDLGGYFGADDALAAGKDMSKQIGDTAMKGVQVAAMVAGGVATGGASLAMSAGSLAGKMASGAKAGTGSIASSAFQKDYIAKNKDTLLAGMSEQDQKKMAAKAWEGEKQHRLNEKEATKAAEKEVKGYSKEQRAAVKSKYNSMKEQYGADGGMGVASGNLQKAEAALKKAQKSGDQDAIKKAWDAKQQAVGEKKAAESRKAEMKAISRQAGVINDEDAQTEAKAAAKAKKKEDRKASMERGALNAFSTMRGLGSKGKDMMPGMGYVKQFRDAAKSGAKELGDPFEAATGSVEYMRGKKVQDFWHDAPIVGNLVSAQNARGSEEVMKEVAKEFKSSIAMMSRNAENTIKGLADYFNSNKNLSAEEKSRQMYGSLQSINANGAQMDMSTLSGLVAKAQAGQEIKVRSEQDLKIKVDGKSITEAVEKAMAKGKLSPEEIRNELQGVFANLGAQGEANLLRIISDAIAKVSSQIGGK